MPIDFDAITYYLRATDKQTNSWDDLPQEIKDTYDRIGVPEAEKKFLAGVSAQYESEVVYESGSIFSLWVEEPSYSNITGIITFNGGIPTPGFTGSNGTAISIVVKAKEVGQANFIFSDSAVRANDGLGTDVLNSKNGKTLSIVKNTEPAIAEPPAVAPVIAILPLQITSPTHPSQELWYKDVNPLLRWKVPTGIDAVQISMDNNTSGSPRVIYSPAINQKSFQDLKDGIWYFKSRARKNGVWGPVTTFITRVDSTAPQVYLRKISFILLFGLAYVRFQATLPF
jgi:hypothetical protein